MSTKPTCPRCGSDNVAADAAARWNPESPEGWEVSTIFDKGHGCDDCEASDFEFIWVELPEALIQKDLQKDRGSATTIVSLSAAPASYSYRVAWYIDVEAESPQDAAASARAMQLDPESIATVFNVQSRDGTAVCIDTASGEEYPSDCDGVTRSSGPGVTL